MECWTTRKGTILMTNKIDEIDLNNLTVEGMMAAYDAANPPEPVTPEDVLHALATAHLAPSMEVDADTPDAEFDAFLFGDTSVTEPVRLIYPELVVITVARAVDTPDGTVPAGTQGTIVHSYPTGEAYEVEFPAPWHVVTVQREHIVLSEDDADACAAAEEFANASPERRDEMIEMVRQLLQDIRADLVAEHCEEMVDLMVQLPEVIDYDDMGPRGNGLWTVGRRLPGSPRGD
jgi:hypothetical protein